MVGGRSGDGFGKGEAGPGRDSSLGAWPGRNWELAGGEALGRGRAVGARVEPHSLVGGMGD